MKTTRLLTRIASFTLLVSSLPALARSDAGQHRLWSDQALKMTLKSIEGTDYLFVESGGFNTKHGPEWKSPLYVMKRR